MNLEQIYERHADFVWRTLRRLGVTDAEARDAAHDVFLIVHAHLDRFEGRSSLSTWLFAICRSVARDFRRRERRDGRARARDWVPVDVDEAIDLRADVGRAAEHQQQLLELERILSTLSSEQRNVFVLFEIEKLTGEEIAEALAIPLGTVYSRLQLARKSFRAEIERTRARERFGNERARAAQGGGRA
ncbi:MAG TPA: sigma-70 family RNA polymerase sigma factor [Polyangiaceae bacterium]|nr:sigma-70 family RNA polymerase sigma factor [Polyangiaceae bacterium]